jgi:hypothetical protein
LNPIIICQTFLLETLDYKGFSFLLLVLDHILIT